MGFDQIVLRAGSFIPVILALTVHEWAHARVALHFGDDTALQQGRLTLNPLAHLDPIGTVLLPLLGVPFGWAKPVPVDPSRFRPEVSMGRGMLLTAAAGPVSNLVLAMVCAAALRSAAACGVALSPPVDFLLSSSTGINLALAIFNLLPIPPLDGSRIVEEILPFSFRSVWNRICSARFALLIALFIAPSIFGFGIGDWVMDLSARLTGR
ncbi:MAG: site-2 protease family protein [Deltaproteobacteria bacterium]|nr:MAG: site-2 protease family protein [Deltaproteobacteria bacterium]TMB32897.1 MAG: site-2 protease family protein [Deltaproteobacteria bacterium]